MFPMNAWYVACTPQEIDDKPLGRTICNQPVVLYRSGDGTVAALEDFCPHRGAPLSLGKVIEGQLVCGYHGLTMGCDGKTLCMPGQTVRRFPTIRRYPVVERHGFVWLWPGDAALADESTIHPCDWADNPDWAYGGGSIPCMKREVITSSPSQRVSDGVSSISFWPMLVACT